MRYFVYALKEAGAEEIRYVGFTHAPAERLGHHLRGETGATSGWVSSVDERGPAVEMVILAWFFEPGEALDFESHTIRSLEASGAPLLNVRRPGARSLRSGRTDTDGRAMLATRAAASSQTFVAETVGVNQSTISSWVRGLLRPEAHHRSILSSLYGIPTDAWLTDEERAAVRARGRLNRLQEIA